MEMRLVKNSKYGHSDHGYAMKEESILGGEYIKQSIIILRKYTGQWKSLDKNSLKKKKAKEVYIKNKMKHWVIIKQTSLFIASLIPHSPAI